LKNFGFNLWGVGFEGKKSGLAAETTLVELSPGVGRLKKKKSQQKSECRPELRKRRGWPKKVKKELG